MFDISSQSKLKHRQGRDFLRFILMSNEFDVFYGMTFHVGLALCNSKRLLGT